MPVWLLSVPRHGRRSVEHAEEENKYHKKVRLSDRNPRGRLKCQVSNWLGNRKQRKKIAEGRRWPGGKCSKNKAKKGLMRNLAREPRAHRASRFRIHTSVRVLVTFRCE